MEKTLKTDCFGAVTGARGSHCAVLKEALCVTGGRCPFYKTKAQARADTERARLRAMERGYYIGDGKYGPREGGA